MLAAGMVAQGAGLLAIILATFILNLRHLIMSTCVIDRLSDGSRGIRLLAAFGITDETFAFFTSCKEEKLSIFYFLGLATVAYSSWNAGTAIGAVASDFFPAIVAASFAIALYAMFVGLLVPNLTSNFRLGLLVVLTAICNTVLNQFIASSWALIISTLLCAFIGVFFVDLPDEESESEDEQ